MDRRRNSTHLKRSNKLKLKPQTIIEKFQQEIVNQVDLVEFEEYVKNNQEISCKIEDVGRSVSEIIKNEGEKKLYEAIKAFKVFKIK